MKSRLITVTIGIFVVLMVFSAISLYSQETKIRIIKKDAVVRLKPNNESLIIKKLPLGAVLSAEETIRDWIKIKLPPDRDGVVVTGYIHSSFVEFEIKPAQIKPKQKPILTEPKKEVELPKAETMDMISSWRRDLDRAKSRNSTGKVLTISGVLVLAPCLVLTFVHQEHILLRGWKARTGYLIGDVVGLTALIAGLAIHLPARGEIKRLEEEGRRKGYIRAGLLPKYKAIGIQVGFSF